MSQSDPSAPAGSFSGIKPMEGDPSLQFRAPWIGQTQIALQVELSRLNAVAESLKTQEAGLLQKIQELSDTSDSSKLQNFSNGTTEQQRQTLLATFQQQLQQVRAEQTQMIHSFNALQQIYSQLRCLHFTRLFLFFRFCFDHQFFSGCPISGVCVLLARFHQKNFPLSHDPFPSAASQGPFVPILIVFINCHARPSSFSMICCL